MNPAQATQEWYHHIGGDTNAAQLMNQWRESLLLPGESDPCISALRELAMYFHISEDEARHRCERWEQDSVSEWESQDRNSDEGLLEFYRTTQSWIFDTVWYHAKQCSGEQFPESVAIIHELQRRSMAQSGSMLDFGAGPGSTGMFFHHLGWHVSMGDISTTMQAFAKWRCQLRGIPATFYDTSIDELPSNTFDLITAIDVVAHIRDWEHQLRSIHTSLKEGGLFIFNVDARPQRRENQWHLYQHHYPLLRPMRRSGFEREPRIEFFYVYRKEGKRSRFVTLWETAYDVARYNRTVSATRQVVEGIRRR